MPVTSEAFPTGNELAELAVGSEKLDDQNINVIKSRELYNVTHSLPRMQE